MWSDESLIEVAKLLRSYHDATVGFTTTSVSTNRYPGITEDEVVCHNDFAPYNVVFKDGCPQGIIDFDMAGPGRECGISPMPCMPPFHSQNFHQRWMERV
ncbi:phosphotransferase [Paenibacillus polymyxa]|uniref:phosphotransferase n=1 Tax=Paenibacillus polymyxa TaxID=1406 RepID=UPI0020364592|nr:phosphotransferase [Paenibacillus polymyxa]